MPRAADLAIVVDVHAHPDFLSRDISFGFGPWGDRGSLYNQWCIRNRMTGSGNRPILESGHAYQGIYGHIADFLGKGVV